MSAAKKRCAVYTRKSTEEGLDQAFNSLNAQAENYSAYILSQAGKSWTPTGQVYSDGGISGGHMERLGLQALIADIEAGQIDIIVVYKVDRPVPSDQAAPLVTYFTATALCSATNAARANYIQTRSRLSEEFTMNTVQAAAR